jgi:hypothetical protein
VVAFVGQVGMEPPSAATRPSISLSRMPSPPRSAMRLIELELSPCWQPASVLPSSQLRSAYPTAAANATHWPVVARGLQLRLAAPSAKAAGALPLWRSRLRLAQALRPWLARWRRSRRALASPSAEAVDAPSLGRPKLTVHFSSNSVKRESRGRQSRLV